MPDETEKMVLIPVRLRDELLEYLSQRPYREVANAVAALVQAQETKTHENKE